MEVVERRARRMAAARGKARGRRRRIERERCSSWGVIREICLAFLVEEAFVIDDSRVELGTGVDCI